MGIRKHVGAWLVISASKAARTTCRLFATSKVNAAACGHRLAQLHAGVMTDALSMIRNAAAASSTHQFQLGTPLEWFAVGRHYAARICRRQRMPLQMLRKVRLSKRLNNRSCFSQLSNLRRTKSVDREGNS